MYHTNLIEIPHYAKPYIVNGTKVWADNAYDAAMTNVHISHVPAKVGDFWAAHERQGTRLVQVGEPFRVNCVAKR